MLLRDWGLGTPTPFHRDPVFLAGIAAGVACWCAMALWTPPTGPMTSATILVSVLLWQPLVEELAFRGVLQGWLLDTGWAARRAGPLTVANGVTSVAFAALHFVHHPPLWAAGVLFPSLMFGWLRERHASVYPALALHIFYNSGYFLLYGRHQ